MQPLFEVPQSGQQIELTISRLFFRDLISKIDQELIQAELKFPKWPKDLNYGDQVINEEKGEATKALLDICQGKATIDDVEKEYIQMIAMVFRQLYAVQIYRDSQ